MSGGERLHGQGWPVIGPSDPPRPSGLDKVVLAISPQWLDGRLIGTVDTTGSYAGPDAPGPLQRLRGGGRASTPALSASHR
jgi:hypothetical protein